MHESKTCTACGRSIEWRKKWERNWEEIKYCSNQCRKRRITPTDEHLEIAIVDLLAARSRGATICPSEAARSVAASSRGAGSPVVDGADDDAWRQLMEPARNAARRLVARGEVVITQRGKIVDPSTAKGPIRIRKKETL